MNTPDKESTDVKHNVYYDEVNGVLRMKVPQNWKFEPHQAQEFMRNLEKLFDGKPHRRLLCDITMTASNKVSKEIRRWMHNEAKKLGLEKIALVVASPVTRMVAKTIIAAMGESNHTRFFKTQHDALAWIKEATGEAQDVVR